MSSHVSRSALLVRASEAERLADGPSSLITLFADSDDTHGALTANRATLQTGSPGAPAHFHTLASELLFVLGGSMMVLAGEEVHTLEEGDFFLVPPRVPHAFAPASGRDADALVLFTPGLARFDYYRLLERVAKGEASVQEIRDSSEHYDNHYVDSPAWREALAAR
ncbi:MULTISPECIES: cupin domain-containing protein [unclassified Streptomyces]|uniref:cupin domain-containing protein n=1 Tax=unclassified Streptomyces TaxID=2593676 RepID=UPI002366F825|nr:MULTISPECIES: cupin domain-containing protein [unclassified Streptomyces]MDF3140099.1 cupin domain-containing protein [Streptomyces sp. T21Q-yed]WDF40137.1 cupin domain-containing protein [Streptomyces sp. T12]